MFLALNLFEKPWARSDSIRSSPEEPEPALISKKVCVIDDIALVKVKALWLRYPLMTSSSQSSRNWKRNIQSEFVLFILDYDVTITTPGIGILSLITIGCQCGHMQL